MSVSAANAVAWVWAIADSELCAQVFCHQFGYGLTVTADKDEPIDIGMQFVKSGHYQEAHHLPGRVGGDLPDAASYSVHSRPNVHDGLCWPVSTPSPPVPHLAELWHALC